MLTLVLWRLWIVAGWRKLIDTGNGFILRDAYGVREYLDCDIQAADFSNFSTELNMGSKWNAKTGFGQGIGQSFRLTLWIQRESDNVPERLTLSIAHSLEQREPIQNFVDRIHGNLCTTAKNVIETGGSVNGRNWTINRDELTIGDVCVSRAAVQGVSTIKSGAVQILVAREGSRPAQMRVKGQNAFVLAEILREQIAHLNARLESRKTDAEASLPAMSSIGKLLHQVDVAGVWSYRKLACFEDGVAQIWPKSSIQLRYDDIAEFTYSATHAFTNSAYSGSTVTFVIRATAAAGGKKWTCWNHLNDPNCSQYDLIRDMISSAVATRMLRILKETGSVEWSQGLRFLTEGLERTRIGFLSRSQPVLIPYASIEQCVIEEGLLRIRISPSTEVTEINLKIDKPNVFPGQMLLAHLRQGESLSPSSI